MSRARNKSKAGLVFILIILIAVIATAAVIVFGVYSNGFESMSARYITVDGTTTSKLGSVKLAVDGDTVFDLKGAGFKAVSWGEYEVKIEANPYSGLEFEADGQPQEYADIDFTEYFAISKISNRIIISEGSYGAGTLLAKKIPGATIKTYAKSAPYKMTVTPQGGKAVTVYLNYNVVDLEGIELNPSEGIIAG